MKCLLLLGVLASPLARAAAAGAGEMDMDMSSHDDDHHHNSHADAHPDAHADVGQQHDDAHSGDAHSDGAHDDDDSMDMSPSPMSMEHHHGRPILSNPHLEPQQRKYWEQYNTTTFFNADQGNKTYLYLHATLAFIAFGLMAPLSIITSTDSRAQWFYFYFQCAQMIVGMLSIGFFVFYSMTAPKLYPGNVYFLFSVLLTLLMFVHWCALVLKNMTAYMDHNDFQLLDNSYEDAPMLSVSGRHAHDDEADEEADSVDANAFALDDLNEDRREPSLSSTEYGSGSETDLSSFDVERDPKRMLGKNRLGGSDMAGRKVPAPLLFSKLAGNKYFRALNSFVGKFANTVFHTLNFPLFFAGYGYLLTGVAIAFLMGKDKKVFGLLAHFIKGFVFFALGFVELGRFFGMGASRGWSWNQVSVKVATATGPKSRLARIAGVFWPDHPTFEFVQSFLIFFYGATNVFLEHLGNEDGVWSHKDLQHASIAFMFFGGGLCGLILESNTVKKYISRAFNINNAETTTSTNNTNTTTNTTPNSSPYTEVRRGYSLNPMPAFIIFWTGALMSHHQQETELSTQIHVLWGTMFSLGAVIRLITIGLLFTRPVSASSADAAKPQRPFTEVLVSFCLVCGGMIFMSSNRETVEGMIYRGMDQMFTLNVSVGITVLLMAYFVMCLAAKGLIDSRSA